MRLAEGSAKPFVKGYSINRKHTCSAAAGGASASAPTAAGAPFSGTPASPTPPGATPAIPLPHPSTTAVVVSSSLLPLLVAIASDLGQ